MNQWIIMYLMPGIAYALFCIMELCSLRGKGVRDAWRRWVNTFEVDPPVARIFIRLWVWLAPLCGVALLIALWPFLSVYFFLTGRKS
ncbi:hypothetical protein [Enterobacter ludwigii]|uniref:hypothetical protein n=1 Tax=Enterobacter ludwigii TaxID=299767 RepID=UPI000643074A|nr:hypothetical protein [Enterobacter ludwigii]KLP39511.1 hypothetical protein ABR36_10905 [Enterobacter ludwigii]